MAKRADDLLSQIERDVLDESKPVAAALRKCLILGGRAGSAELRDWASRELHGYPSRDDPLPDYRRILSVLKTDGFSPGWQFTGHQISVVELPDVAREHISEDLELVHGIGEIEAMIRPAEANGGFAELGLPLGVELARMMSTPGRIHVDRVYRVVSVANLQAVTDGVRTALTELLAELRGGTPTGAEIPSAEVTGQALQVVLHGSKHRVTINNAIADGGGTATATPNVAEREAPGFWTTSRRIGAAIVGLAAIVTAVAAILALHP
jgi:hypothetical protein